MIRESEVKMLDQQRAENAWSVVSGVKSSSDEKAQKEFGTQAKKLPTRIVASGLGQALAFLEAKDYAPALRDALTTWMGSRRSTTDNDKRLFVRILKEDADFQRYATAECLAYLVWLVRFAEAENLTKDTQEN